jgi:uncharacterized membrane protein
VSSFTRIIEMVAAAFELAGVGIIVGGFVGALIRGVRLWPTQGAGGAYVAVRSTFGRGILLGLEILVAGDIIRTVALQPTIENLMVLGLLVVIRTFLAWSMEVEIDGQWPWRRAQADKTRGAPRPDSSD